MDSKECFPAGDAEYEIHLSHNGLKDSWYEVLRNREKVGRWGWPKGNDDGTLMPQDELVRTKIEFYRTTEESKQKPPTV